jgi:hypothetical protein
MVSLVDIVPQKRSVSIAAGELELRGLCLRQIAHLFLQFPSLRNKFTEGAPEVDLTELIALAPDAIATIIAEAAGQPEAADKIADGNLLTPEEMLDCLEAIHDLTFPRGMRPLLERLGFATPTAAPDPGGKDQATNTPQPPSNSSLPDMLAAK